MGKTKDKPVLAGSTKRRLESCNIQKRKKIKINSDSPIKGKTICPTKESLRKKPSAVASSAKPKKDSKVAVAKKITSNSKTFILAKTNLRHLKRKHKSVSGQKIKNTKKARSVQGVRKCESEIKMSSLKKNSRSAPLKKAQNNLRKRVVSDLKSTANVVKKPETFCRETKRRETIKKPDNTKSRATSRLRNVARKSTAKSHMASPGPSCTSDEVESASASKFGVLSHTLAQMKECRVVLYKISSSATQESTEIREICHDMNKSKESTDDVDMTCDSQSDMDFENGSETGDTDHGLCCNDRKQQESKSTPESAFEKQFENFLNSKRSCTVPETDTSLTSTMSSADGNSNISPVDEPRPVQIVTEQEFPSVPNFKCIHCKYWSYARLAIEEHVFSHCKSSPWHCGICFASFGTRAMACRHHRNEHKCRDTYLVFRPVATFKATDHYWHLKTETDKARYLEFERTRDPSTILPTYQLKDRDSPLTEKDLEKHSPDKVNHTVTLPAVTSDKPATKKVLAVKPMSRFEKSFLSFLDGGSTTAKSPANISACSEVTPTAMKTNQSPNEDSIEADNSVAESSTVLMMSSQVVLKDVPNSSVDEDVPMVGSANLLTESISFSTNSPTLKSKPNLAKNQCAESESRSTLSCTKCSFTCRNVAQFEQHTKKHERRVPVNLRLSRNAKSKALDCFHDQAVSEEEADSSDEYEPDDQEEGDDDDGVDWDDESVDLQPALKAHNQQQQTLKKSSVKRRNEESKVKGSKQHQKVHEIKQHGKRYVELPEIGESERFVYECMHCPVLFSYLDSLDSHLRQKHDLKLEWFPCPFCYISTRTKRGLYTHTTQVHSNVIQNEMFEASIAVRGEEKLFTRHIYTVTNDRKHLVSVPRSMISKYIRPVVTPATKCMTPKLPDVKANKLAAGYKTESSTDMKNQSSDPCSTKNPWDSSGVTACEPRTGQKLDKSVKTVGSSTHCNNGASGHANAQSDLSMSPTSELSQNTTSKLLVKPTFELPVTSGSELPVKSTFELPVKDTPELPVKSVSELSVKPKAVTVEISTQTETEVIVIDDDDDDADDSPLSSSVMHKSVGDSVCVIVSSSSESDMEADETKVDGAMDSAYSNISHDKIAKPEESNDNANETRESRQISLDEKIEAKLDFKDSESCDVEGNLDEESDYSIFNIQSSSKEEEDCDGLILDCEPADGDVSSLQKEGRNVKAEVIDVEDEDDEEFAVFNVPVGTSSDKSLSGHVADGERSLSVEEEEFTVSIEALSAPSEPMIDGLNPELFMNYEMFPQHSIYPEVFECKRFFHVCDFICLSCRRKEILQHLKGRHTRYKCGHCPFNLFFARHNALKILERHHYSDHPCLPFRASYVYL